MDQRDAEAARKPGCPGPVTCGLALLSEIGGEMSEYGCLDWDKGTCKAKDPRTFQRMFNRAHKEFWRRVRAHWLKENT